MGTGYHLGDRFLLSWGYILPVPNSGHLVGDVELEVVGSALNLPAQPNDNPDFNWATTELSMNKLVWMVNGSQWRVSRPPVVLQDARYRVVLQQPGRTAQVTLVVPADRTEDAIWNLGIPHPVPEPVEEVENPDAPTDPDPVTPGGPLTPPQPPVEPTDPITP